MSKPEYTDEDMASAIVSSSLVPQTPPQPDVPVRVGREFKIDRFLVGWVCACLLIWAVLASGIHF